MKRVQSGFATLVVAVLLLVLGSLGVLSASRVVFFDQVSATGAYKQAQAAAAAKAGIEKAIAYLSAATGTPNKDTFFDRRTRRVVAAAFPYRETLANDTAFSITITQPDVANDPFQLLVTAVGCADGCTGTAQATATQVVKFRQLLPRLPQDAIIARGDVSLRGATSAENPTGTGYAVLAGGTVDASTTAGSIAGGNTLLAQYDPDAFFMWFFGETKTKVRDMVPNLAAAFPPPGVGGVYWIEGDTDIHSNAVFGSVEDPVVLIVNGNLQLNAGVTVYGIVYVVGGPSGWQNAGGGTNNIIGAAISEAGAASTGNLDIRKDSDVLNNITAITYAAKVSGGWKDF